MEGLKHAWSINKITSVMPSHPIRKIKSLSEILNEKKPVFEKLKSQLSDVKSVNIPENSLSYFDGIENENKESDNIDIKSPVNLDDDKDEISEQEFESNHLSNNSNLQIKFGICCMEKKLKSRPMQRILEWL